MYKIAHVSDPHVSARHHPSHLPRLRTVLEHALRNGADHIVIAGDLASDPYDPDWKTIRDLFSELGIYDRDKLTLTVGNHDIFGGPQGLFEILMFQVQCYRTDYGRNLERFTGFFSECFRDTVHPESNPFPFIKRVDGVALIVFNSVLPFSFKNLFASNGRVRKEDLDWTQQNLPMLSGLEPIVVMHHHLIFRKDDRPIDPNKRRTLFDWIHEETLRLRNQAPLLETFRTSKIRLVLHGHVHFTTSYEHEGFHFSNAAGSIKPFSENDGLRYNMIALDEGAIDIAMQQAGVIVRI